jgi:hypothetical protein
VGPARFRLRGRGRCSPSSRVSRQSVSAPINLIDTGQLGLFCLHAAVELAPAVVGGLGDLQDAAEIGNALAIGDQLIIRFQLADDLLGCVAGSFHGGVPGPVWPD